MTDLDFERKKLEDTIAIIRQQLGIEQSELDKLFRDYIGSREELWRFADLKKVHIENLKTSLDNPYFARIDFTADEDGKSSSIYIGKNGLSTDDGIIITDWRAPISSLYYDSDLGRCSYIAPMGEITGNLSLKRQYDILNGELIAYFDVDLVSNDQLLQRYLNENNDSRLKSIVATIQKEQNAVIRQNMYTNLIVQGVAGSGKTTVALHRIAYLVYNHMQSIRQSQFMVIGPNKVFLKYIRSVLPELDVAAVRQCTYEEFAKDYIGEDIEIIPSDKKVAANIAGNNKSNIDKFKCSIRYKEMLDRFLEVYFYGLTSEPLKIGGCEIIPQEVIKSVFDSTDSSYVRSLKSRIESTISILSRMIEDDQDKYSSIYSKYVYDRFKDAPEEEKEKIRDESTKGRNEINRNCRTVLRKYFSKAKLDPTKLYRLFISTIAEYNDGYKDISRLKKETLQNIKQGKYDFEDLAALIYIKSVISPDREYNEIKHVVVDEAQDFGEFNFYSLRRGLPSSSFSIFGDLAQSIYDYRGVDNWEQVNDVMFGGKGSIVNFSKSYRTTAEIMGVADSIAEYMNLGSSELVVRHGEDVSFTPVEDENIPEHIASKILEYKEKGYRTIAVISKTDLLSNYINDDLRDLGIVIPNVGRDDDVSDPKFSVCTISNQLAKGLEFDAVIINNAGEKIYNSDSSLDQKMLYVATTRALHELDIPYSGELTRSLSSYAITNEDKVMKKD
ncbi:MAG: UvrD-helicase domain-containing protein [Bacilli bacterium]|nr:UvrD-helicase domain-containing protein [Bacilli bacterium]